MSDLYKLDILEWSERQAAWLRRIEAGERVNDVDWVHLIDEVESVGREQLHAVESLLTQTMLHALKAEAWPLSPQVAGWRAEARLFRRQAIRRFAHSMRRRIDIAELYADALAGLRETIDDQSPLPVADICPFTLDAMLSDPSCGVDSPKQDIWSPRCSGFVQTMVGVRGVAWISENTYTTVLRDRWARSSAGEHRLDTAGVGGSIPLAPTRTHKR